MTADIYTLTVENAVKSMNADQLQEFDSFYTWYKAQIAAEAAQSAKVVA